MYNASVFKPSISLITDSVVLNEVNFRSVVHAIDSQNSADATENHHLALLRQAVIPRVLMNPQQQ